MKDRILGIAESSSLESAGGKAHALYAISSAGFNVPDGFVVSANSFMAMTPELEELILNRFDALQTNFVAVRSSAINEDGKEAAWAGQLDTFLNCTRANLIQRIQQCWSSASSDRAKSYAEQRHMQSTKVAVLVQEMIQPDTSGVAFSVHPVTSDPGLVVIEAGFGLGEALVSGHITPDTYIVQKQSRTIMEKHVSRQEKMLAKKGESETSWVPLGDRGERQKLTDQQISTVSHECTKLEKFFGYPVDVEWAISGDRLYILQCRPITSIG